MHFLSLQFLMPMCYATSSNPSILGPIETFIGVLTTVILLCVIMNQNNFILGILNNIKEQMLRGTNKAYLDILRNESIEKQIKKLKQDNETLETYLDNARMSDDLKKEASAVWDNVGMELDGICDNIDRHDYAEDFLKSGDMEEYCEICLGDEHKRLFSFIDQTEEQTSAPLYTFIFCLIIFLSEHLIAPYVKGISPYIALFLYIFTFISVSFWLSIWIHWIKRTCIEKMQDIEIRAYPYNNIPTKKIVSKWLKTAGIAILLVAVFLIIDTKLEMNGYFFNYLWIIFVAILLLLVFYRSKKRLKTIYANYHKIFILSHEMFIIIVSALFVLLLWAVSHVGNIDPSWGLFENKEWLRFTLIIFIVSNGLIAPFCMPLFRYNRIRRRTINGINKRNHVDRIAELQTELNTVLGKINDLPKKNSASNYI